MKKQGWRILLRFTIKFSPWTIHMCWVIINLSTDVWFAPRQVIFLPFLPQDPNTFCGLTFSVTHLSLAVIIKDGRKQWQDESKSQQVDEECQEDNCNNTIIVLFLLVIDGAAPGSSVLQGHVPSALLLKKITFISSQHEAFCRPFIGVSCWFILTFYRLHQKKVLAILSYLGTMEQEPQLSSLGY